jgi:hypothetical protein
MSGWEEWRDLEPAQREYALYKVLSDLYNRECKRDELCQLRGIEIENLKRRKLIDRGVSAIVGTVVGILGALGVRIGG